LFDVANERSFYRAIDLRHPSLHTFLSCLAKKWNVAVCNIIDVIWINKSGNRVRFSDDIIRSLPDGVRIMVDFQGTEMPPTWQFSTQDAKSNNSSYIQTEAEGYVKPKFYKVCLLF
jgi:hypothetical protein